MKTRITKVSLLLFICILSGFKANPHTGVQTITHYNVVIVPDLSNRLQRGTGFPDEAILRALVQHIYPDIVTHGRSMNQKDRFRVVLSSQQLGTVYNADLSKMAIDLGTFKHQRARIDYLMGRTLQNLKADSARFLAEFLRIEKAARQKPEGADIWSFFNTGLDRNLVATAEGVTNYNSQKFQNIYRNILILLTDGYIEAGVYGTQACDGNICRYLSSGLIKKFRRAYAKRTDKKESMQSFFYRNRYGITAADNPYLKNFEVLVLQVDDRSLTPAGNATVAPTDYQVIRLFWEDWMKKSGAKRFEMYPLARDAQEAGQNILSFMGIR